MYYLSERTEISVWLNLRSEDSLPQSAAKAIPISESVAMNIKLSEILKEDLIIPDLSGKDAASVLRELSDALYRKGLISNPERLYDRLTEREKQESTGIGNGVAIPHCKMEDIQDALLVVGYAPSGIDFHAVDGGPTFIFFLVVTPVGSSVLHLRILAALSRLLKSSTFRDALQSWPSKTELLDLIRKEEEPQPTG